eukprot:TRINITY_DN122709_c0_g1_i1.p1 TRINITY_DN122709_c0_g1~~TRINITY_DN122709_c0_g1_i1.p1  ORF type:complete len:513 (-),score=104.92 TRINITY_DN122709_c0_g1_i1:60-1598(-)
MTSACMSSCTSCAGVSCGKVMRSLVVVALGCSVAQSTDDSAHRHDHGLMRRMDGSQAARRTARSERQSMEAALHPQREAAVDWAGRVTDEGGFNGSVSLAELSVVMQNTTAENANETTSPPILTAPTKTAGSPVMGIGILLVVSLTCAGVNRFYRTRRASARQAAEGAAGGGGGGEGAETGSQGSDVQEGNTGDIGEDVYAAATMSIIRDMSHIYQPSGSKHGLLRWSRILYHVFLLLFATGIQLLILRGIMMFGMPTQVLAIRQAYDAFEIHMYKGKVFKTENGFARGLSRDFWDASLFETMDADAKEAACRIPMSEPSFLAGLLFLWTAICVGELRTTFTLFDRLILNTESAANMGEALSKKEDSDEDVVVKLTIGVKILITFVVLLPRVLITGFLVWVGCRWLTATNDFQNLVFNGVGLEFVLLTKDLVYKGLVSDWAQREVQNMKTLTLGEDNEPTPTAFLGSIQWGIMAIVWVYMYIFNLQRVLPQYNWDINEVCHPWRIQLFSSGP